MKTAYLLAAFAPLIGAIVAGLFGRTVGRAGAHTVTIAGVAISFAASLYTLFDVLQGNTFDGSLYTWASIGGGGVGGPVGGDGGGQGGHGRGRNGAGTSEERAGEVRAR